MSVTIRSGSGLEVTTRFEGYSAKETAESLSEVLREALRWEMRAAKNDRSAFDRAVNELTEAINVVQQLTLEQRETALETLRYLNEQAGLSPEKRSKPAVIGAAIATLTVLAGTGGGLAEVWSTWGNELRQFLGGDDTFVKVFISWSGEQSHRVALALHEWLPLFIQSAEPWVSSEDIAKGTLWRVEREKVLESESIGIFCITKDNIGSIWVNYEAGALAHRNEVARVIPFLFEMAPSDMYGPLTDFQRATFRLGSEANREEFRKLLDSINTSRTPPYVTDNVLRTTFSRMWQDFEPVLSDLAAMQPEQAAPSESTGSPQNEPLLERLLEQSQEHTQLLNQLLARLTESPRSPRRTEASPFNWETANIVATFSTMDALLESLEDPNANREFSHVLRNFAEQKAASDRPSPTNIRLAQTGKGNYRINYDEE